MVITIYECVSDELLALIMSWQNEPNFWRDFKRKEAIRSATTAPTRVRREAAFVPTGTRGRVDPMPKL